MDRFLFPSRPQETELATFLQQQFNETLLASEKLRATVLGVLFALSAVPLLIIIFFLPYQRILLRGASPLLLVVFLIGLLLLTIYELLLKRFLERHRENPRRLTFIRYWNALEETVFITLIILFISQASPASVLLSPPVWVYFIVIMLSGLRLDWRLSLFTGVITAVQYGIVAWLFVPTMPLLPDQPLLETGLHLARASLFILAGIVTGIITEQIKKWVFNAFQNVAERNEIVGIFGQHVSPQVVEQLLQSDMEQISETREVCVLFLDIRNFSGYAEQTSPDAVVDYLNTLFAAMITTINAHHGIINKFLGDGFMAVFGAPLADKEAAQHAVEAALALLEQVETAVAHSQIPPTRIGIGIHGGAAVTGTIGSSHRREYTVIGDVVNIAARIEQLNKQFASQLLVSGSIWQQVDLPAQAAQPLGAVPIRGHETQVPLYQLG